MFTLHLETDMGQPCPYWFTETDSKLFCNYMFFEHLWQTGNDPDVVGALKEHLGLDVEPLLKVASEDLSLEDWMAEGYGDEGEWRTQMEINKAAWQSPQELASCLQEFIQALDNSPNVFSRLGVSESYFVEGYFKQDLVDLLRMVAWALDNGAGYVRLSMG
ncbi:MAG: hypothetical protein NZ701_17085 [Roseiflexus sp.]|nr:hypothetical protein [Roseiflexus sp.]